jgi:hypothetical protein
MNEKPKENKVNKINKYEDNNKNKIRQTRIGNLLLKM